MVGFFCFTCYGLPRRRAKRKNTVNWFKGSRPTEIINSGLYFIVSHARVSPEYLDFMVMSFDPLVFQKPLEEELNYSIPLQLGSGKNDKTFFLKIIRFM